MILTQHTINVLMVPLYKYERVEKCVLDLDLTPLTQSGN